MSLQSNIIGRSGNLDQTRAVPFLMAVSNGARVAIARQSSSSNLLNLDCEGIPVLRPPMLLGCDEYRCPLTILELLGHGRPWVQERIHALQYETDRSRDGPRGLIFRRSFRVTPASGP
jgi:hypothetical protein